MRRIAMAGAFFVFGLMVTHAQQYVDGPWQEKRLKSPLEPLVSVDCNTNVLVRLKATISEAGKVVKVEPYGRPADGRIRRLFIQVMVYARKLEYFPFVQGKQPKSISTVITVPCKLP